MTAGSGIVHQEMPKGRADGSLWGFQLWVNLPASHKMMDPRYRDVRGADIPEASPAEGVRIGVIAGEVAGERGPVRDIVTDPGYLDVSLGGGITHLHEVPRGHTVVAYVIGGAGYFSPERDPYQYDIEGANWFDINRQCLVGPETLVVYGEGDRLEITSSGEGARFLLFTGKPIGEPVAWYGPIVMNTREELRMAFEEYDNGTFLRSGKSRDSG
jgi:redox-sensitive bicupin YhaK (pirin superfamily)